MNNKYRSLRIIFDSFENIINFELYSVEIVRIPRFDTLAVLMISNLIETKVLREYNFEKKKNLIMYTVEKRKKKTIRLSENGDQTFCGPTFREHELGTFGSLEFLTVKSIVDNFRSAVLNSEL